MQVIVDFTVVPVGTGVSLSPFIAEVARVLERSGLHHEMHANGTNLEGEWDQVMAAIRVCHETLHAMGVPRIHTDIKLGTRSDRPQQMSDKLASVHRRLGGERGVGVGAGSEGRAAGRRVEVCSPGRSDA